jgi:hypothetical protein
MVSGTLCWLSSLTLIKGIAKKYSPPSFGTLRCKARGGQEGTISTPALDGKGGG